MKNIFTLCAIFAAQASLAFEVMPADNLRAPLLLQFDNGNSGSGFYYADISNGQFLVTAKHVLFDGPNLRGDKLHVYAYTTSSLDISNRIHAEINLAALYRDGLIKSHATHDVAVCKIGNVQTNANGELQVVRTSNYYIETERSSGGELVQTPDMVLPLQGVPIGNEVYIFGYPSSIGIQQSPQIEYEKPLLRRGIIAGKNLRTQTLILDCPVYYGNSGGPVLLLDPTGIGGMNFRAVGVVSQFVPFVDEWKNIKHGQVNVDIQNSGYSVVEPMDFVIELCK